MIYDHKQKGKRAATSEEKMLYSLIAEAIVEEDDEDALKYNDFESSGDSPLPYFDNMAKGQRIALVADFLRKVLNDEANPFEPSAWADSVAVAVLRFGIGAVSVECDTYGEGDADSETPEEYQFYWRRIFLEFTDVELDQEDSDYRDWDNEIEEFAIATGLIPDERGLEELERIGFVEPYDLEVPPSDWVGKWEYDLKWIFALGDGTSKARWPYLKSSAS